MKFRNQFLIKFCVERAREIKIKIILKTKKRRVKEIVTNYNYVELNVLSPWHESVGIRNTFVHYCGFINIHTLINLNTAKLTNCVLAAIII